MNGLKYGVSNNQLAAGLIAGFIATHVATITGFWYEIFNFPAMDWSRWNGTYLVGFSNPGNVGFETGLANDFETFITGYTLHTFTGLALSLAFVFLIHPKLPSLVGNVQLDNIVKACIWGLVLAVISFTIIVPLLDVYNNDPGWFSLDLKLPDTNDILEGKEGALHPGWKTPVAVIIWHLVYGIQLGSFYSPKREG